MKKITVILLCMAMLLSGCAWGVKAEAVSSSEDVWKTIEKAYIYAFPLVLMDATRTSATNTEEAAPGKAPVNQFMHGVALANAQFKNVVMPNVDTIYTQVWKQTASARCRCLTHGQIPSLSLTGLEPMRSRAQLGRATCRTM